jgi:hypothetical protein
MEFYFGEESKENGHDDTYKVERFIQKIQQVHQAVQEWLEKSVGAGYFGNNTSINEEVKKGTRKGVHIGYQGK